MIRQNASVKMLRVDGEMDVLPELNEDGRPPRKLIGWRNCSSKMSGKTLYVDISAS